MNESYVSTKPLPVHLQIVITGGVEPINPSLNASTAPAQPLGPPVQPVSVKPPCNEMVPVSTPAEQSGEYVWSVSTNMTAKRFDHAF